jgi:hypothetical protein
VFSGSELCASAAVGCAAAFPHFRGFRAPAPAVAKFFKILFSLGRIQTELINSSTMI